MTLFSTDQEMTTDDLDNPQTEEGKNYVDLLVGEGKKFKDLNSLAASNMHKDTFIQKLIQEKREIEAELQKRQTVEDIYKKLKSEPPAGNPPAESHKEETGPTATKPEDIERIVFDAINRKTKEQTEAENLRQVTTTLEERLGPNYQTEMRQRVKELGIGEEFATSLAKTNPKAFLKLVGADAPAQKDLFTPPRNELRTVPKVSSEKTYSYYEKLRKADPQAYYASQSEMFEQAKRLGDAFYQ